MSDATDAKLTTAREAVYAAIPRTKHAELWALISELEYAVIEDTVASLRVELTPTIQGNAAAYLLIYGDMEVDPVEIALDVVLDNTLETYNPTPQTHPEDVADFARCRRRLAHALWSAANRLDLKTG